MDSCWQGFSLIPAQRQFDSFTASGDRYVIGSVTAGSDSMHKGLKPGVLITAVNGVSLRGKNVWAVKRLLLGKIFSSSRVRGLRLMHTANPAHAPSPPGPGSCSKYFPLALFIMRPAAEAGPESSCEWQSRVLINASRECASGHWCMSSLLR